MRWEKILIVMFIVSAVCVQLMPTHDQRIFGLDLDPDPFGLRRRKTQKKASKEDDSDYYEPDDYDEDEPHTTPRPSLIPGFPLNPLDIFKPRGRSGDEHGRGRGKGRGKNRDRGNGHGHSSKPESEEEEAQQSRRGNSRRQGTKPPKKETSEPETVGPCGPNNQFCHGENYVKELQLNWSPRVQDGTGIYLRDPNAPGGKRFVPIGIEQPNEKYDKCETPEKENGYCRHLEHCVLDAFRNDFITFLRYKCDIPRQNFVGVCCPVSQPTNEPRTPNFPFLPPRRDSDTPGPTPFAPRPQTTKRPRQCGSSNTNNNRPSQNDRSCGALEKIQSRIVGGRIADPKSWPWMAALLKKTEAVDYRSGQYCGGVLISEFHVLTAGHCVDGFEIENLAVRIGEYDFARNNDSNAQDIDVADVFIHENYNRYSYKNDIAVIKLSKSAFFDDRIRSICLPPANYPEENLENEKAIVTGFGKIYYGGPTSDKLMEITVPVWKQEDCQNAYTQPIEETNLCAGVRSGSRDSCQGDSGGPLQYQLRGRWTTNGVVSWGIRCAEPGYSGVYSRVSSYTDWINKRMRI